MGIVIARGYDLRVEGQVGFYHLFPQSPGFKVSVSDTFRVFQNKTVEPFRVWYPTMKKALEHLGATQIVFSAKRRQFTKERIDRLLTALKAYIDLRADHPQRANTLQQVVELHEEIEPQLKATSEELDAASQMTGIQYAIEYEAREWGYG